MAPLTTGLGTSSDITGPAMEARSATEPLLRGWERLDERSGWAMGHSAWLRAWIETAHAGEAVRIVATGAPEAPSALIPFVACGRRGERLVAVTGGEPADVSLAGAEAADALAEALVRMARPLELPRVPAESPIVTAVRAAYRGRGIVFVRPAVGTPTIPLDAVSPDDPEAVLSSRRRSDLRRARRRAERLGDVRAEFHAPRSAAEADALLDEAIAVEAASWKGREGTALACDPHEAAAIRRFVHLAAPRGLLSIALLRIDGDAAAMQIAIEKCAHYGLLKIGYDARFRRCSPGQLLMLEAVRHAARRRLASVEMLGAVEPWTEVWTKVQRLCVSVRAYPAGPAGTGALARDVAAVAARRARRVVTRRG